MGIMAVVSGKKFEVKRFETAINLRWYDPNNPTDNLEVILFDEDVANNMGQFINLASDIQQTQQDVEMTSKEG